MIYHVLSFGGQIPGNETCRHKDGAIHTSCYHMLNVSHWFHKICSESLLLHKNSRICKHIQKVSTIKEETKSLSFEYTRKPFFLSADVRGMRVEAEKQFVLVTFG